MTTLIGISGSLRRGSFNSALLHAATALVPDGARLEIADISAIPLYNYDVEVEGIPPTVAQLKDQVAAADGLLICTPEYNNSIPGVLKNAIDWMTRPPDDVARVFHGRCVAVMGASPGPFGTILSQNAWLPVLRTLGTRSYFQSTLYVASAGKAFDANGILVDVAIRERLRKYLQGFAAFI